MLEIPKNKTLCRKRRFCELGDDTTFDTSYETASTSLGLNLSSISNVSTISNDNSSMVDQFNITSQTMKPFESDLNVNWNNMDTIGGIDSPPKNVED